MTQPTPAEPRIAAIVPVLRDSEALRTLLADLRAQSRPLDRIIVVSAGQDKTLLQMAKTMQFELIESIASRGVQLDVGARAADAQVLWFIHADARLPREACAAILTAIERGALGGCLRFELRGGPRLFRKALEWLVRLRIACGGISYGDQALFCTREVYLASGGFPQWPLFEEVPLVRYVRRRHGFAALDQPVYVAARRWERDGWLRRSLHNRWLALRFALGASPQALAASYRRPASEDPACARHSNASETHG